MTRFDRLRALLLLALCLLLAAPALAQGDPPAPPRDYWPTGGWRTADPAEHGFDPALLEAMDAALRANAGVDNVDSVLIVRDGYLVFEAYYNGYDGETPHQLRSATKSFVSALVGIALEHGLISGVEATISELLPRYFAFIPEEYAGTAVITVDDLLTMRSGLLWREDGRTVQYVFGASDPVMATLTLPQVAEPGLFFNYSSADAHMLAAIISAVTAGPDAVDPASEAATTPAYIEEHLFSPLGITDYVWHTDPQGRPAGGGGLELLPRDMAKFGFLYLNNGLWDGAQIVPAAWVAESQAVHVAEDGSQSTIRYGYLWWLDVVAVPEAQPYHAYAAMGYGGQHIVIVPELDLVVVRTGDVEAAATTTPLPLVSQYVIPAILAGEAGE